MNGSSVFWAFLMNFGGAVALEDGRLCYILDGILVVYGIVLTVLYCKLRLSSSSGKRVNSEGPQGGGIYQDLHPRQPDTYETLPVKKKGIL